MEKITHGKCVNKGASVAIQRNISVEALMTHVLNYEVPFSILQSSLYLSPQHHSQASCVSANNKSQLVFSSPLHQPKMLINFQFVCCYKDNKDMPL